MNKSGQTLGRKGHGTQSRIVEATERLLTASRGLPPSVSAIAREAQISPPTFYLYFADIAEAVFATVQRVTTRLEPVLALLEEQWPPEQAYPRALAFIEAYFGYFAENSAVLRARNRLADEGSAAFIRSRLDAVGLLGDALAGQLQPAWIEGEMVADQGNLAGIMLTAIERTATVAILDLYPDLRRDWRKSVQALAFQLSLHVRGRQAQP